MTDASTRLWGYGGVRFLHTRFSDTGYPRHVHGEYSVGLVVSGALAFDCGRKSYLATPGQLTAINPEDVHTGTPGGPHGWEARGMLVPSAALRAMAPEFTEREEPAFRDPIIVDRGASLALLTAHVASELSPDTLASDVTVLTAAARLFLKHAVSPAPRSRADCAPGLTRARDYIRENYADNVRLAELAAEAGLSEFHFVRAFARAFAITPHAYLVQVRLKNAARMLRERLAPAEVAAAVGFADQSHLSRVFRSAFGLSPAAYARAA